MKNKTYRSICLCLCVGLLFAVPSHAASQAESWYCAHTVNHERPTADSRFSYIGEYDAYYIAPDSEEKVIYLTFDAGYENGNVEKTLDVLKEKNVKAAFFVLSHLIESNTSLVERMFDEGHTVCNHTAKHKDMSRLTDRAAFAAELSSLEQICKERTGHEMSKYYRPPKGCFTKQNLAFAKELGYKTIFWSFAYADWNNDKQMAPDKAAEKIMSNLHAGEVMLLHPTSATNATILGEVIDQCHALGYRFGTLDELTEKSKGSA